VWPLGLLLGLGGLIGAWAGSTLSTNYLADMKTFRPFFGGLTLLVAARIGWDLLRTKALPTALEGTIIDDGVSKLGFKNFALSFRYGRVDYQIPAILPLIAGFIIAFIAAIFGVGGGFLLVPFLASFLKLPMHVIPATAAIAIIMSLLVSIANYLRLGAHLDYSVLIAMLLGTIIGAMLGAFINRNLKDQWLQMGLGLIVLLIGLKYILA
ncbi:MAG TPA: sulfite exporter TauE/SafE family protein, partial [Hellea balneolensis]|nr:sulfite exporter TauE/SafE family protein [Hellea balneolensis]